MATYADLTLDTYYLIKDSQEDEIELVCAIFETEKCVLLRSFTPEPEDFWKKKSDVIAEVIEEVDDEKISEFENIYDDDLEAEFDDDIYSEE
ncbi:hypothetical protein [Pinibacter aurantiacus]|uniref:Uncharacterized protein n=1 Tax=Pinibacter aurantiacus TaxID=2851599 RepID=A0A9E2S4J7_9BACT|nr:hypothetical protein [Pinibacter aurantiacus]MBV4355571.1 hypothetical protein [Pinibacter aurantiacus]